MKATVGRRLSRTGMIQDALFAADVLHGGGLMTS